MRLLTIHQMMISGKKGHVISLSAYVWEHFEGVGGVCDSPFSFQA